MSDEFDEPRAGARSRKGQSKMYQPKPLVAGILLVVFVATLALAMAHVQPVAVGGGSGANSSTTSTSRSHPTTIPPKASVRVQVANGTSVNGLAHTVTTKLQLSGWDVLAPLTGPTPRPPRSTTCRATSRRRCRSPTN